jgi:hypothetical protein
MQRASSQLCPLNCDETGGRFADLIETPKAAIPAKPYGSLNSKLSR